MTASPKDEDSPLPSVEMGSMSMDESRPPTVVLSRQNLGGFFQVGKGKLITASRFVGDEPPLTDRYGFICQSNNVSHELAGLMVV
jgi:hypothetical protein